jgi:hypothetical protein
MFSETDKQQILKEWRLTQKSSDKVFSAQEHAPHTK